MKIIYESGSRELFSDMDDESQDAVKKAIELIEGKTGFKTYLETWRNCNLIIRMGHNIYTTSIIICPTEKEFLNKYKRWHNGHAYFCNGKFWANWSRIEVELI